MHTPRGKGGRTAGLCTACTAPVTGPATAKPAQVEAIGITAAAPHLSWRLPPGEASDFKAASAVAGGPLAALVAMLNAALAFESDPHVAISLLASAAACASGAAAAAAAAAAGSVDAAAGGGKSQVRVVLLLSGAWGLHTANVRQHVCRFAHPRRLSPCPLQPLHSAPLRIAAPCNPSPSSCGALHRST